jgi:hypothetical protein
MTVKMNGKPFTGVTYNQGSFTGDRGHLLIAGQVQCSSSLNLTGKGRIWEKIETTEALLELLEADSICKVCVKQTKALIKKVGEGK